MASVSLIFCGYDNVETRVNAEEGISLMEAAQSADLDVEGTCEGNMACSTCHMILDQTWYQQLKAPSEEEQDMLDFAIGLTRTSRLGCQILVSAEMDGMRIQLPKATQNMMGL